MVITPLELSVPRRLLALDVFHRLRRYRKELEWHKTNPRIVELGPGARSFREIDQLPRVLRSKRTMSQYTV